MLNCANCGKDISFWSAMFGFFSKSDFSGNYFCTKDCKSKYYSEKKELKSKGIIKEMKCKCNQCKHIWHYLEDDEKKLKGQAAANAMIGCGMCCSPFSALFSNKSLDLQREADKMKKCPKCNSTDVTKTPIYHEKKS